jgi:uncharacterized protein YcbK (DUF882 family)
VNSTLLCWTLEFINGMIDLQVNSTLKYTIKGIIHKMSEKGGVGGYE